MDVTTEAAHRFVDVLEAEQASFAALLGGLRPDQWSLATPADGWDVMDQVSHLADTEEVAFDTVRGGTRALANEIERHESSGGVIEFGVARGRGLPGAGEVLGWWMVAAERNRQGLRSADPATRVPWGLGMSWRAFVTARLMEHWAHGLDIRSAVGAGNHDTDRLQPIGWLAYGALPYAFGVAGVKPPSGRSLRVEVTGPSGDTWSYGPETATDLVTGPAGIWCRRAVQRITPDQAGDLTADGALAEMAILHARAFL